MRACENLRSNYQHLAGDSVQAHGARRGKGEMETSYLVGRCDGSRPTVILTRHG
jgi:hypothetical protein